MLLVCCQVRCLRHKNFKSQQALNSIATVGDREIAMVVEFLSTHVDRCLGFCCISMAPCDENESVRMRDAFFSRREVISDTRLAKLCTRDL